MKREHPFRTRVETWLVEIGLRWVPWLPRPFLCALAETLGTLSFLVDRRTRRVALANLACVWPEMPRARRWRVARANCVSFAYLVLDLFWFSRATRARLDRYFVCDPTLEREYFQRPVSIVMTAHLGNWEVMGVYAALRGHPTTSVYNAFRNPVVNEVVRRLRGVTGQPTLDNRGVVRALLRVAREGGRAALLIDQNIMPVHGGVFAEFFGRPVPMSTLVAALSRRTGLPVVPAFCVRESGGRYRGYALPPLVRAGDESDMAFTQRLAAAIESEVRRTPGQWMWSYKRWKIAPDGEELGRYPFYGRHMDPWERERGDPRAGAAPST